MALPAMPPGAQVSLYDLLPEDLEAWLTAQGQPAFRATQLYSGVYSHFAPTAMAIPGVPKALGALIDAELPLGILHEVTRMTSSDGRTTKLLLRTPDGCLIEGVLMHYRERSTACISSQAGCALQCAFCATGAMGFTRNLKTFEIAGQVREMRLLSPALQVTNVVFMGMGEPLMNWKAVEAALTVLNAQAGLGIGARHITVSTVGVLPGIVALGERAEQFRLAISIHAPNDELRQSLIPINTKYPLASVIQAAKVFDRRVTFEYVMLGGINDGAEQAIELANLARECGAFVNLIPLHPGGAGDFTPSSPQQIQWFARRLRAQRVEVAVRKSRGMDIAAACGQLRVERQRRRTPIGAEKDSNVQVA